MVPHSRTLAAIWTVLSACAGPGPGTAVRPGLEVLVEDSIHLVRGRTVGILTNQSGVTGAGESAVEYLLEHGVDLVAIFAPEHGFRGAADPGASIANSVDSATGLPIYSLYGTGADSALAHVGDADVVLVDLQDVGARYFTWLHTIVRVLEAAGPDGPTVYVLDRPNPIGGLVQGNVLDPAFRSPVGRLAIPMRHGMTLGELALLARADLGLEAQLGVIPMSGWRRDMAYDETGLPFLPPSPNLRELEALFHYPGLCLFEGTALSVGRGTERPFLQVGAPWLDTTAVLAWFRRAAPPGVEASGVVFVPRSPGDGKLADTTVRGIRLRVTDRKRYDPTLAAVELLEAVVGVHGDSIGWRNAAFDRLAGGSDLRESITAQKDGFQPRDVWRREGEAFLERRRPYLLYGERPQLPERRPGG